jgi:hypothetical protein
VVVVNDNGSTGTFSVQVGECLPPIDLREQYPQVTAGAENWYDFFEIGPPFGDHWIGAAVRSVWTRGWCPWTRMCRSRRPSPA